MTENEAIKELHEIRPRGGIIPQKRAEAIDVAINALEKQIPKKPIMKQYFDDMEEEYLCCPTCGEILTDRIPLDNKDFYLHCLNCGPKLDWSGEE